MKFALGGVKSAVSGPSADEVVPLPAVDSKWYLATYSDVGRVPMEAEMHYRMYGHRLGRDPSSDVSTAFLRELLGIGRNQNPLRALRKLAVRGMVAKGSIDPGRALLAASVLARRGQLEKGLSLAERWLPSEFQYRAHVLRANLALERADEATWLAATNQYLSHYGVSPVSLYGEGGSLFDRIQSSPVSHVDGTTKVTIIVAAWNSERTVAKALRSLLAQSWRNIELLIVDDCSTDSTWDVISQIAAEDQRVKAWRNSENVGPYVSKSLAASYATGSWITCHDADDWAHPERIERQLRFCAENNQSACLSGMLRLADSGEFTRLNQVSEFVYDGACRGAFVSLFMCAQVFHDLLGAWDQVRAGGDSELLRRLELVIGKPVQQLRVPTMFCRDHVESLTNSADFGFSAGVDVGMRYRLRYKNSYLKEHAKLTRLTTRYVFPLKEPRYDAGKLQVPIDAVEKAVLSGHRGRINVDLVADVVIITNARFPGGNASSTLDELRYFRSMGLRVALVHCPVDTDVGRSLSARYRDYSDIIYQWSRISRIEAKVLICRHPRVVVSRAFSHLVPRIHADHAFVVKNNSNQRPDGRAVYDVQEMVDCASAMNVGVLEFCPISRLMREELLERVGSPVRLSKRDWTPTFDPSLYYCEPKRRMDPPYAVGRHARDGLEKWRESPNELLQAYPPFPDFTIRILGGAAKASLILGNLPENWVVQAFGEIEPLPFLRALDAFVYFPNSKLVEGFGRTLVEAMIAGVPVITSGGLAGTFGELVLSCEPHGVEAIVRRLALDGAARVAYLKEVQELALARYGAGVIAERLLGCGLELSVGPKERGEGLSDSARRYRAFLLGELSS